MAAAAAVIAEGEVIDEDHSGLVLVFGRPGTDHHSAVSHLDYDPRDTVRIAQIAVT